MLPKDTSEILETETEIPTEKYIYPEKRQQNIADLRLV